jgi:hypothetical protein
VIKYLVWLFLLSVAQYVKYTPAAPVVQRRLIFWDRRSQTGFTLPFSTQQSNDPLTHQSNSSLSFVVSITMGLFAKKKGDREVMIKQRSTRSNDVVIPTASIQLKDSEEENSVPHQRKVTKRVRRVFFKRTPTKPPTFRRFNNELAQSPRHEYRPPAGFTSPHSTPVAKKIKKKRKDTPKLKREQLNEHLEGGPAEQHFRIIESTDSSANEYEPPPAFDLASQKTDQTHLLTMPSMASEKGMHQFVFDSSYQTIEKVAVERSDPGDFSDFIHAAARVKMPTPSKALKHSKPLPNLTPPDNSKSRSASKVGSAKKISGSKRYPSISAETLLQQQQSFPPTTGPPKTILMSSNQSVVSNVSVANATITGDTTRDVYPKGDFFHTLSGDEQSSDPFKAGAWLSDGGDDLIDWTIRPANADPFFSDTKDKRTRHGNNDDDFFSEPKKSTHHSNDDALIRSIKKATTLDKKKQLQDESSYKPDPSPRGGSIRLSSSDSFMDFPTQYLAREKEIPQSNSDGGMDRFTAVRGQQKQPQSPSDLDPFISIDSQKSIGPQKRPPKGVPNNAILGSMIFNQNFSTEESRNAAGAWGSQALNAEDEDDDEEDDVERAGVPFKIHATKHPGRAESTVSSITDDASSFYQKNFDVWGKQAQNVLSHWHQAKIKESRNPNLYRADAPTNLLERVKEEQRQSAATANLYRVDATTRLLEHVKEEHRQSATTQEHLNMFSPP